MVDELSGSKGSRDIANLPYFSESTSVDLDLILAVWLDFISPARSARDCLAMPDADP